MDVEVSFSGLCCVIRRDANGPAEVYLPTGRVPSTGHHGHGAGPMEHVATLAVPAEQLDLKAGGFWAPTGVIQLGPKTQIAYWRLEDGDQLSFESTGVKPAWNNESHSVQFGVHHPRNLAKPLGDLNGRLGYPVLLMAGGTLAGEQVEARQAKLPKNTTKTPEPMARTIVWTHHPTSFRIVSQKAAASIQFRTNTLSISVTNVARVPGPGREHFDIYYQLLIDAEQIANNDRVIYDPDDEHTSVLRMPNVYDCVPPTGGS